MATLAPSDLPPPPPGKRGWPWTEGSGPVADTPAGGGPWPRVSVVTPSYNQREFLEEAIRSVLLQSYPNLEYVILDGGSSDRSAEILETYAPWLGHWRSERDDGQYDAIQRGFELTEGEVMAWLNSDDVYAPGALARVGSIFAQLPAVEWLTSLRPFHVDGRGRRRWCRSLPGFSREAFRRGEYVVGVGAFHSGWIPQESTFWRRDLWRRTGAMIDTSLVMAGDYDLWARFFEHADLHGVATRLGGFRRHEDQKTSRDLPRYVEEAREIHARHGDGVHDWPSALVRKLVTRLPVAARRLCLAGGLAYRGQVIVPDKGGDAWRIESVPV